MEKKPSDEEAEVSWKKMDEEDKKLAPAYCVWNSHRPPPVQAALQVQENQALNCKSWEIYGPLDMYISLQETYNALEDFMKYMQECYDTKKEDPAPDVILRHVYKGQHVALQYDTDYEGKPVTEWHRGKILRYKDDGSCEIRLIDFGTYLVTNVNKLKLLHQCLYGFTAQAIHCKLSYPPAVAAEIAEICKSKREARRIFLDILRQQPLIVVFKKLHQNCDYKNDLTWEVDMYLSSGDVPYKPNSSKILVEQNASLQELFLNKLRAEGMFKDFA